MENRYYRKNRRKYMLKVHVILVTKYRKKLLNDRIAESTKRRISELSQIYCFDIIVMETDRDHIHLLLEYDTTVRVCDLVKVIKQQTTQYLWDRYPAFLSRHFWKRRILWSDGYFACSIGEVSSATIEKYIASQG